MAKESAESTGFNTTAACCTIYSVGSVAVCLVEMKTCSLVILTV